MIIDCISDLHGCVPTLRGGDVLIVAGDCTARDKIPEWARFFEWLKAQDYQKKILVAGNHDVLAQNCFPKNEQEAKDCAEIREMCNEVEDFDYLCDSGIEYEGLKIWGTPYSRSFVGMNPECMGFTKPNEEMLWDTWEKIPLDTDILITHCPPLGILDISRNKRRYGSSSLFNRVVKLKNLKLHVFGHIHGGYGWEHQYESSETPLGPATPGGRLSVNAAQMDDGYDFHDRPIRVILEEKAVALVEEND